MTVDDLNITLASGAANATAANGAGITVDGASATLTYNGTNDDWNFNKGLNVTGNLTSTGIDDNASSTAITIDSSQNVTVNGNLSATKLTALNGTLELDDNGTHNGIINVPASLFLNLDSDNTNTGEYFAIAKDRSSTSGGTELFRVQEDGNVGIGTASPNALVEVQENVTDTYSASASSAPNVHLQISNEDTTTANTMSLVGFGSRGTTTTTSQWYIGNVGMNNAYADSSFVFGHRTAGSTWSEVMRLDGSGNVGIGNTNPYTRLHVKKDSDTDYTPIRFVSTEPTALITNTTSGALNYASLAFTTEANGEFGIGAVQNSGNTASDFVFVSRDIGSRAERVRITSDGNLLVGTTSVDPVSGNVTGTSIKAQGNIQCSRENGPVISGNRKGDDGVIFEARKNGTTVGGIGTKSSGIYIGTEDAGIFFNHHGGGNLDAIFPYDLSTNSFYNGQMNVGGPSNQFGSGYFNYTTVDNGAVYNNFSGASGVSFSGTGTTPCDNTGTLSDGSHDLGRANARFKDLYLSGGAYLGGTAAANHLDDYEKGTFTAYLGFSGGDSGGLNYTNQTFAYTKVGRLVTFTGFLTWNQNNFTSSSGRMYLRGLPFTIINGGSYRGGAGIHYSNSPWQTITVYQQEFRSEDATTDMTFNFADATDGSIDSEITTHSRIQSSGNFMVSGTYMTN